MSHEPVAPGTIVIWSDVTCPWASLAVHRLHQARSRLGMEGSVWLDHHAFPLELVNHRPTPHHVLEAEMPVIGSHEPTLGWRAWQRSPYEWPGTVLLALEAVQAAKHDDVGGLAASDQLDHALRRAFFAESRPIGLLFEVLEVAAGCPAVDEKALEDAICRGEGRAAVIADWRGYEAAGVAGSPHLFLPDGSDVHNPGVSMEWTRGKPGSGFPRITMDDPNVYDDLLRGCLVPAG